MYQQIPEQPQAGQPQAEQPRRRRARIGKIGKFCERHNFHPGTFRLIVILLLIIVVLAGVLLASRLGRTTYDSKTLSFGLKDIGELATQAGYYTNVNVINNPNRTIIGIEIPFTSSKALTTYSGVIKAGVDFTKIKPDDNILTKTLTLNMPAPEILSNEVDLDSLTVYDETNSTFNKFRMENFNQSLITMKEKAEENARANGIMKAAKTNAETIIRSFLLGSETYKDYTVKFVWEEEKTEAEEGSAEQ